MYFKTQKLTVGYNKTPVIKDIEIEINKGEIITLIGSNGAGKSTILKSIAGQLSKIAGTVYLDEKDISEFSGKELSEKMAVLFTDKINGEMKTCEEVVSAGRYPYTGHFGILSNKDKEAVEETMKIVGIEDLKDCDFMKLSDGQKQRVLLAKALCQEPEILLLDEPTSYLDIKYKLDFLSVLEKMKKEKQLTVIMSMHELDLAAKVSDKILCLKGEYADRYGKPEEIFKDEYISTLFGIDEKLNEYAKEKGIDLF